MAVFAAAAASEERESEEQQTEVEKSGQAKGASLLWKVAVVGGSQVCCLLASLLISGVE